MFNCIIVQQVLLCLVQKWVYCTANFIEMLHCYASFFQELKQGSQALGLNLSEESFNILLKYQDA